jgi:hypothetical protein
MFTRRRFLHGITFALQSVAIGNAGWIGLIGNAKSIELPVPDHLPKDAKVLIRLRHRISSPEKWCQSVYMDGPKRCLIGALIEELNVLEETKLLLEERGSYQPDFNQNDHQSCFYLLLAKRELFPDFHWRDLERWNDDPDTSHDDVLRVLDRAIECATSVKVMKEALERIDYAIWT